MAYNELYQMLEGQEKITGSNPYQINAPVTGSKFFGREPLLSSILEILASATPRGILIFGSVRMGKSSLLQELRLRLSDSHYLPVYWGAKNKSTLFPETVWRSLAETIASQVGVSISSLPSDFTLFKTRFLPQIHKKIAPRRLVLLLDDIDLLEDAPAEVHTRLEALPQLLVEKDGPAFVLTTGTRLPDLLPARQSFEPPLFYEELPPLSSQESFLLIMEGSKSLVIGFLAKTIDQIWELAAGHPYYVQLISHETLNYALKEGKQQIDPDSLDEVLPLVLEKSAPDFARITANLSEPARDTLAASAAAYRQQLPVTPAWISFILNQNKLTLGDKGLADSFDELEKFTLLDQKEPGTFSFTIPLMAHWLFQQYPLHVPALLTPTPLVQPPPSPRRKLMLRGGALFILLLALVGFGILAMPYNALTETATTIAVNVASSGQTPTAQPAVTLTATELPISAVIPTSQPTATPLALLPTHTAAPPLTPPATTAPTATPTFTPSPAPTSTPTLPPPTATPLPTFTVLPTATPLPTFTALPTVTPIPTVLPPTLTPPPSPTASAPPARTPTLPAGSFTLLNPLALDQPSYGPTEFEWQWTGPVPPGTGFEVRVWREGAPQMGVHDAVYDNQEGVIESLGENKYRLKVDITEAAGVQGLRGEYWWTVALVRVSPNYGDLRQQAPPAHLRFEPKGSGDGGSGDGSGGGGGTGSGGGVGVN